MPAPVSGKHTPKAHSRNGDFLAFLGQKMWSQRAFGRVTALGGPLVWDGGTPFFPELLHADAIEERAMADCVGVRVTGCAGLAKDVTPDGGEGRLRCQVGVALEEVGSIAHTL